MPNTETEYRGYQLLEKARDNGGKKLDSYAGNHEFYVKNGFEPVSWCQWVDEYAPDDWKSEFGKEPIVFYKYTGNKNTISLEDFITKIPASVDYDTAMKIRDSEVDK